MAGGRWYCPSPGWPRMMAKAKSRPRKKAVFRFEVGWGGLLGLTVVCFCIFVWMFLLGIWTGQSLSTSGTPPGSGGLRAMAARLAGGRQAPASTGRQKATAAPQPGLAGHSAGRRSGPLAAASFFSLQVAAFRDPSRAGKTVRRWQTKGYESFAQPSGPGGDGLTRVFVGRFANLSDANALAVRLEKQEAVRAYIALLPAAPSKRP